MSTHSIAKAKNQLSKLIDRALKGEGVVITRHGQPTAVLVGVEGRDWEDVLYQTSASFWKMIQRRRKEKTISLREMRKRIDEGP